MAKIEKAKKLFATFALSLLLLSQPGVSSLIRFFPEEAAGQGTSDCGTTSLTWTNVGEAGTSLLTEIGAYFKNSNGTVTKYPYRQGTDLKGQSGTISDIPKLFSSLGQYTCYTYIHGESPACYYSDASLNGDGKEHVHVTQSGTNSTSYMWEDATWHWDWNDLAVRIDWQSTPCPVAQCSDGIDNDQDGAADYPNDFSCSSATDNDETNPKAQCQDGIDNDGDGRTDYPSDPGCSSKQDNSEKNSTGPQCDNGIDDDQDGKIDYPQDPGCTDPTDNSENTDNLLPVLQISKVRTVPGAGIPVARGDQIRYLVTVKNTGNGTANGVQVIDPIPSYLTFIEGSPACRVAGANVVCDQPSHAPWMLNPGEEHTYWMKLAIAPTTTCNTLLQNRAQIVSTNHAAVWSNTVSDTITCAQCSDGIDNDQDGATDYPNDFSCSSATDNDETNPKAQCQDGIDNDGDGRTDYPSDPGCSSKQDNDEHNICPTATQTSTCRCATNADCTNPDTCQNGYCRPQGADLSVLKTATENSVTAGGVIHYSVTATNNGPATATNVVIADVIPANLIFNAGQSTASCVLNGNGTSVLCNNFNLTSGQSRTFTIAFTVPAGFPCGGTNAIVNQATVSSSQGDPVTANNTSTTVTTPVTCPIPQADLSIRKSGPSSVLRGDTVTYTVTVENAGPNTATNVVVSDVIPFGLTFNAAGSSAGCILNGAGTSVLCNNFNLNAGEIRTFTLAYTVPSSFNCGATIRNTADVSSSSVDPVSANNHSNEVSTSVSCPTADITIVKSGPQSVNRGGNILYTLTVTNLGPQRSDNVVVVDRPESMAGLTYSASQSDPDCVLNGTEVLCNNISLQAGQSRTYNIVFAVSSTFTCGSTIANRANANVSTPDPHGDNNWSDRIVTTVNCAQCSDGIDNDQDGATDYPNDFSCDSPTDNDETNPKAQCQDGIDNDGDGRTDYSSDPGCSSKQDNDEYNVVLNPDATIQKSGPTTVIRGNTVSYTVTVTNIGAATAQNVVVADIIPAGLTFVSGSSSPECVLNGGGTSVLCNNFSLAVGQTRTFTVAFTVTSGIACGSTILNTATVSTSNDTNPANNGSQWNTNVQCITPQCSDNLDNDQDGATDYPNDFSCSSPTDDDETFPKAQCQDGVDNDQDGAIDYPSDIGCTSAQDNDESNPASPDLSITKTGPQIVNRGSTVSYTVIVTNIGTATALNAVVADVIPAGLTFHGGLSSTDCLLNGGGTSVLCNNFSLAAGQTKNFTIAFTVPTTVSCGSTIRNTATVSTSNDQNGSNNTSQTVSTTVQCITTQCSDGIDNDGDQLIDYPNDPGCSSAQDNDEYNVILNPDATIQKSGPTTVIRGNTVNYTVTVTNIGTATALNAVVADVIPSGLTFHGGLSSTDCLLNGAGTSVLCNNFSLAVGQTKTFTIAFTVPTTVSCGSTIRNTATVSTSNDQNGSNNTSQTVSTTVECPVLSADLGITKTANVSSVMTGDPVSYTLMVTNSGPEAASNVVIGDALPAGVAFDVLFTQTNGFSCYRQSSDANHLVCVRPSMAAGETATIRYQARVINQGTCTPRSLTNTANVTALSGTDPNSGNNYSQSSVQLSCPAPTFAIAKTDNRTAIQPGEILSYAITVTNTSDSNDSNVTVTDALPANVTFLSASDAGTLTSNIVTWQNISIPAHMSKTLTATVQVEYSATNGTIITNTATVAGISAQDQTIVQTPVTADLSITKTGPQLALLGSTILYTVTVYNAGPGTEPNATVTDVVPTGLTFLPQQSSAQCALTSGTVTCSGITLAQGQSQSFTLAFQIPISVACGAILLNNAEVHGSNDPNCVNDLSQTVTTAVQCINPTFTISKTDGRTTAQPGETLTYMISVTNTSAVNATNVTVTDVLPTLTTFITASDGGTASSGIVTWSNLSIAAGATKHLTVQGVVSQTAAHGAVLTNYATVAGQTAQDSTTIQIPQTSADLSIIKTGPMTAQQGSIALYTVTVYNAGPSASQNVVIGDVIPAGFTFNQTNSSPECVLNGTSSSVLCNNFTLTAGQSRSFTIAFNVTSTATCNAVIQNTATVSTSNDPNGSNNTSQTVSTTVQCPTPTFTISKTDNQTVVLPGATLTYVVSVTNTSQVNATNVTVTDVL
ncbi:MAG: hypothetical protein PHN33_05060, partial [Candidatus Peribacteraceae bacterium]|nr:hypothetical protein [Candidatus Peribacteraceae bacterium]